MISNAGTGSDITALITNDTSPYFQFPFTLTPLPQNVSIALLPLGIMGLLSFLSSLGLLTYFAIRFATWPQHERICLKKNQYLLLFINLLAADVIQASSFLISFWWRQINAILAPTPACHAQGALINIGNVTSGFFVLLIACHTFYTTVKGRRVSNRVFVSVICGTWLFALILTCIGPAIHGRNYFVRTGVWCWTSALYETERLVLHYIWIFFVQLTAMAIYLYIFVHIKLTMRRTATAAAGSSGKLASHTKISRAARSMIFYPVTYIILTLPLSAGRMWSIAHEGAFLPVPYIAVAGVMIASSGFVDCLLYTFTRRQIMSVGSSSASEASGGGSHLTRSAAAAATANGTDEKAGLKLDEDTGDTPRRPSYLARALSAASLKAGLASPTHSRSVSMHIVVPAQPSKPKDPYGLDTIDLERGMALGGGAGARGLDVPETIAQRSVSAPILTLRPSTADGESGRRAPLVDMEEFEVEMDDARSVVVKDEEGPQWRKGSRDTID